MQGVHTTATTASERSPISRVSPRTVSLTVTHYRKPEADMQPRSKLHSCELLIASEAAHPHASFEPLMSLRYPPLSTFAQSVLRLLLASPMPRRPKSIADEERKLWWRRWRGTLVLAVLLAVAGAVGGGVGGTR